MPVKHIKTFTLGDGAAVAHTVDNIDRIVTVWWNPISGDTIQIRYRVSPDAPWVTKGSYTAYGEDVLDGPVYEVEFQRTAGSGTTSTCGVA